jgi:HK97 family phage major capsid protein
MTPEELAKAQKEAADRLKAEAAEAAKNAGKEAAETAVKEAKTIADEAKAETKKLSDTVDEMAKAMARHANGSNSQSEPVKGAFLRFVEKKEKQRDGSEASLADRIKGFKENRQQIAFDLEEKAALDILTPTTAAGGPLADRRDGILPPNDVDITRVGNYIPGGTTTSNAHQYVREDSVIGGPGMVGEGELKPGMAITTTVVTAPVRKLAVTIHMSEEVLDDMPRFVSYIQARAGELMDDLKDQQQLFGDGTGNNLQGVSTVATTFSAGPLKLPAGIAPTNADVLRAAVAHVRRLKERCTAIFINPDDAAQMELERDAYGRPYLAALPGRDIATIGRVPVVETDAVPAGSFICGNFSNGVQYFDRKARSLRIYDQNGTDAEHNMVLVVIEERGVQEIYRNKAFVKGTFAAGKTALTA